MNHNYYILVSANQGLKITVLVLHYTNCICVYSQTYELQN